MTISWYTILCFLRFILLHRSHPQEFGINIIGEDNKTIIHYEVAARVHCVFTEEDAARVAGAQNLPTFPGDPSESQPGTSGPGQTRTENEGQAVSTQETPGSEALQDTPQQQHKHGLVAGDSVGACRSIPKESHRLLHS